MSLIVEWEKKIKRQEQEFEILGERSNYYKDFPEEVWTDGVLKMEREFGKEEKEDIPGRGRCRRENLMSSSGQQKRRGSHPTWRHGSRDVGTGGNSRAWPQRERESWQGWEGGGWEHGLWDEKALTSRFFHVTMAMAPVDVQTSQLCMSAQ